MGAKAYSLIGTVYMALLNSSKVRVGGYKQVGNVYPFSLQVTTEQKKQISRMVENAGQTLHAKTTITDIAGSMILREWIAETLAWGLSGGTAAMVGEAGTVSAESITVVLDEWVPLSKKGVSSVVAGAHVEGTDYKVNAALGLFMGLSSGGISAGALSVDFSYAAESGYKVDIGSNALIRVAILIEGKNEEDGTAMTMEFDSVVLASSAELNLISDPDTDYEQIPFALSFETLAGNTSPGRINGVPL